MAFPYRYICDLLQQLDDEYRKEEKDQRPAKAIIEAWFGEHRSRLDAPNSDASAILSALLPQKRTDRVYFIQSSKLESIFCKAMLLGVSRVQELRRYKTPGQGVDLADCVENILDRTPNDLRGIDEVTVDEIDHIFSRIAAACRFSSPSVRALSRTTGTGDRDQSLSYVYKRLSPRDAKWFTRLILKDYRPVVLDERLVFRYYHPLLSRMMKIRDDMSQATSFLRHISRSPDDQSAIASFLKLSIGIKVGRQPWFKGRSIKHCLSMGRSREMSCEQKMDGEYCQIHINLRNRDSPIQIFSKSGKDSTEDRIGLHEPIRSSLKMGTSDCPFKTGCILEGELVVFSSKDNRILPFHKIRKHVSRSGSSFHNYRDSQPHDYEHLMIVYFDVLMVDNESLLGVGQFERFRRLGELVTCRKGYAELVPRQVISFSRPSAALRLREAFAECIVGRNEGLVLKPDEPYFDFSTSQFSYNCCSIKLKKEYLQGWGDVGDFAVVGASYDAAKAKEYNRSDVKWTHFFIGCMNNKERARAKLEKPRFVITNSVVLPKGLLPIAMTQCFPSEVPFEQNDSIALDFGRRYTEKRPTSVFLEPLVFDMRCFSFDKSANTGFWSMRFPEVSKIHHDRSYWDAITFTELQDIALAATEKPEVEDSQEMRQWVAALEKADPRGIAVDARSQQSTSSETRTSPVSRRDKHKDNRASYISTMEPFSRVRAEESSLPCKCTVEPKNDLPTPPTPPTSSAAPEGTKHCALDILQKSSIKSTCRKRPALDTALVSKRPRSHSTTSREHSYPSASPVSPLSRTQQTRQPLSQIDSNSPPKHRHTKPQPQMSEGSPSNIMSEMTSSPTSFGYTTSSPSLSKMSEQPTKPKHSCSLAGDKCALAGYSILLAPCISKYPWVTENLLREHGINTFLVNPESWNQPPTSKATTTAPSTSALDSSPASILDGTSRPSLTKRVRVHKICLVESPRQDATKALAARIEAAGLKRRNGDREWVALYDWRILEDISTREAAKGNGTMAAMDPWRKHYVGLA
ncbi:hypothetical protein GGR54DRAFT_599347 [Hypoxylon sp. NC1633]|nr:hypothetical protein GGR54DRAFT_599347 [Hypoxylon sp. NC1633]